MKASEIQKQVDEFIKEGISNNEKHKITAESFRKNFLTFDDEFLKTN